MLSDVDTVEIYNDYVVDVVKYGTVKGGDDL